MAQRIKASACRAGDQGSIHGLGRSPEEGNGNPLQYSCLENPTDRGAWPATVHGVTKSQTRLSEFTSYLSGKKALLVGTKKGLATNCILGNVSKCILLMLKFLTYTFNFLCV